MSRRKSCKYLIQQPIFELATIETRSEKHLEPNVRGSKPVYFMNWLCNKNKIMFSVQEKELWVFSTITATTNSTSYYQYPLET